MSDNPEQTNLLGLTAQIVSAHVANNAVQATALPELISNVDQALTTLGTSPAPAAKPEPAVPIKKSVFADYLICLEDGKKLKMLKRHLMTSYGMTADDYRTRWDLPDNYPMVAPNYAQKRSTLAKAIGLGRKPAPIEPPAQEVRAPARRGRKPKE
jgi:predicted transcriptional regulator